MFDNIWCNSIELIEANGKTTLCSTFQQLSKSLMIHLVGTIDDNHESVQVTIEIFSCLSLTGSCGTFFGKITTLAERLAMCDVSFSGQGSYR